MFICLLTINGGRKPIKKGIKKKIVQPYSPINPIPINPEIKEATKVDIIETALMFFFISEMLYV
jgi:hypothetical protein